MSVNPKISIIIPIYNVEKYIKDCILSVITQSYTDYEVICIDDGTKDNSINIIRDLIKDFSIQIQNKIRIISQQNSGLSVARNTGLIHSRGEYVMFLDSDDWLEKDTLTQLFEEKDNYDGNYDVICFNGRKYFEDTCQYDIQDQLESSVYDTGWDYYNDTALVNRRFPFVCVVLRLYRRSFLVKNNILFVPNLYHEDNMFTPYVFFYAGKVKIIDVCVYVYRIRKGSITSTISQKHILDKLYIANTQAKFFSGLTKNVEKKVIYRTISHLYHNVFDSLTQQNTSEVLKLLDWTSYYVVSRIRNKYKLYYRLLMMSPSLYKFIRRII